MLSSIICLMTLLVGVNAFTYTVPSRFSHFVKRVVPALYTGGKVTSREIQYLAEAGFKSIISISPQDEVMAEFNGVEGPFPSSVEEIEIARKYGMNAMLVPADMSVESVKELSRTIIDMEKPIYVHCHVGYSASLYVALHNVAVGTLPQDEIYSSTKAELGFDYQASESAVALVNEFTKMNPPTTVVPPSLELTLTNQEDSYKYFYWSHRLGNDTWYNMGQLLDTQVEAVADSGYKTVISFRADGESTCRTTTDDIEGPVNNHEFSDAKGMYNVTAEEVAVTSAGMKFINLPVSGDDAFTAAQLDAYTASITEAALAGPVLVHCASGYRSSAYMTAYLARQLGECTTWAVKQARLVGYSFDVSEDDASVMSFYEEVLKC